MRLALDAEIVRCQWFIDLLKLDANKQQHLTTRYKEEFMRYMGDEQTEVLAAQGIGATMGAGRAKQPDESVIEGPSTVPAA